MDINKHIGTGLVFPLIIESGRAKVSQGVPILESSLKNIIFWPTNHRLLNERFGSRIHELLDEPNDNISRTLIRTFIIEAVNEWDSRITVKDIHFKQISEFEIRLTINYILLNTNAEGFFTINYNKNIL